MGCGIKNQPPIFGKIWKYLSWIKDEIKDAKLPFRECEEKPSPMQKSLEDKIKEKGPGFIQESLDDPDGENTIKKVQKTQPFIVRKEESKVPFLRKCIFYSWP